MDRSEIGAGDSNLTYDFEVADRNLNDCNATHAPAEDIRFLEA